MRLRREGTGGRSHRGRAMKRIVPLALIVGVNFGLLLCNEAALMSSGQTADPWSRGSKCDFQVRIIDRKLPLSQS